MKKINKHNRLGLNFIFDAYKNYFTNRFITRKKLLVLFRLSFSDENTLYRAFNLPLIRTGLTLWQNKQVLRESMGATMQFILSARC